MSESKLRFPAEWEPQSAVLLTWPHENGDWGDDLDAAHACFVDIASAIAEVEPLLICVRDPDWAVKVFMDLDVRVDTTHVRITMLDSNDVWIRDYGPLSVLDAPVKVDSGGHLLDFRFNAWGGKFSADLDDRVTQGLKEEGVFAQTEVLNQDLILEGGAIDTDGQGSLLVRERAVLSETRNPGMDRAAMEQVFQDTLGIERVLWLENGHLVGDDTDGHIDTLARYCSPDMIAYQACDDPEDPHFQPLQAMAEELAALRTVDDRPYTLIPLPMPQACFEEDRRLPASYANFLILNERVLLPVYDCPQDAAAQAQLAQAFPDRNIVPVDCQALIRQNGSLHCVTMQLHQSIEIE